MNVLVVTVIEHNVVSEQYVFIEEYAKIKAEQKFLELCKEYCSNFDGFSSDEVDDILMDGFLETLSGKSINITWPELATKPT